MPRYAIAQKPLPSLEIQVAVLTKAVKALTGIVHTYTLPACPDATVVHVRNRLADIATELNWAAGL